MNFKSPAAKFEANEIDLSKLWICTSSPHPAVFVPKGKIIG